MNFMAAFIWKLSTFFLFYSFRFAFFCSAFLFFYVISFTGFCFDLSKIFNQNSLRFSDFQIFPQIFVNLFLCFVDFLHFSGFWGFGALDSFSYHFRRFFPQLYFWTIFMNYFPIFLKIICNLITIEIFLFTHFFNLCNCFFFFMAFHLAPALPSLAKTPLSPSF